MNRNIVLIAVLSATLLTAIDAAAVDPAGIERSALEVRGASYVETVDMLFNVRPGGVLSLGTTSGSVNVQTWSRDQIRLVVTKRITASDLDTARRFLDMFCIRALHGGRDLKLEGQAKSPECASAVGVEYRLWVPKSYNLDIKTASGSISLPDVDGKFSAHTGEGTITVDCETEDLDVEVEDRKEIQPQRHDAQGLRG